MSKKSNIRLSYTFMARARCKFCGSRPDLNKVYIIRTQVNNDPKNAKIESPINEDFFLHVNPSDFNSILYFGFRIPGKSYNSKLNHSISQKHVNSSECIQCDCGLTVWMFDESSARKRVDVGTRKAPRYYPGNF